MQVTREGHWKFGTAMLKSNGKVSRARDLIMYRAANCCHACIGVALCQGDGAVGQRRGRRTRCRAD
jgi:hypothetical protein